MTKDEVVVVVVEGEQVAYEFDTEAAQVAWAERGEDTYRVRRRATAAELELSAAALNSLPEQAAGGPDGGRP